MNLPEIFERQVRDHKLRTDLSGGWMMTIWLTFIITRGDHTKCKAKNSVFDIPVSANDSSRGCEEEIFTHSISLSAAKLLRERESYRHT
jgi:hypothetical protein